MKELKKGFSKSFFLLIFGVCAFLSIAYFAGIKAFNKEMSKVLYRKEPGGEVKLLYSSVENNFTVKSTAPYSDAFGKIQHEEGQYYDFSIDVKLDNANDIEYYLVLSKIEEQSTIPNNEIKIYLEKEENGTYSSVLDPSNYITSAKNIDIVDRKGSMLIYKIKKKKSGVDNYRLRMWLSETSFISNGTFSVDVNVYCKTS